ncbi:Olfactory receptor 4P4 [Sciurus carolinensis]|uniref:Olfactory receptor 4P4 n=1 Tax=Sciurus carolinensis TaxID=30640 RepID=A0AA41MFY1_SCICA|nr:Olfactory receptor 4P4 [Sciurus carolinensis]
MYYFLSHLSPMDICYTYCVTPKLIGDQLAGRNTISYGNGMLQVFVMHFFGLTEVLIPAVMAFDCYIAICKPLQYMSRTSHLSPMDICYTYCVTPKLIGDQLAGRNTISYGNSMLQVFVMHFFGLTEVLILAVMAFDCYIAISKPLQYMSRTRCNILILAAWAGGAAPSFSQFFMIIWLPFCGPNEIDHYYCDIFPLLQVACTNTHITGVLTVANSGMAALVPFIFLFGSYVIILFTLRNQSAEGRRKALSTCESHITVVILFFGPSIFAFLRPPTTFPEDKIFALLYTIIAPMFNPLIYTLRNTEMKKAMRKVWCQKVFLVEKHN